MFASTLCNLLKLLKWKNCYRQAHCPIFLFFHFDEANVNGDGMTSKLRLTDMTDMADLQTWNDVWGSKPFCRHKICSSTFSHQLRRGRQRCNSTRVAYACASELHNPRSRALKTYRSCAQALLIMCSGLVTRALRFSRSFTQSLGPQGCFPLLTLRNGVEWLENRRVEYWLIRILICSHIRVLRTACFARALRCLHSFAHLLTHSESHMKVVYAYGMNTLISHRFK